MATKTDEQEQTAVDYLEHAVEDLKQAGQEAEDSGTAPGRMEKVEQRPDRRRLPPPFGPRKPKTSPCSTAIVTSSMPRWLP